MALAETNYGEIQAVGAGIGGFFKHTSDLKVMKYEDAISSQHQRIGKKRSRMITGECRSMVCGK